MNVYRKTEEISEDDEFSTMDLSPEEMAKIPPNFDERLILLRKCSSDLLNYYIGLCEILERLARNDEAFGMDYNRLSTILL
jgi:hypothetical protein